MVYQFDTSINRAGTGSLKWDKYKNTSVLPLWVADMDFVSAPEIVSALHERVSHGVFGYTIPYEGVIHQVLAYLQRIHGYSAKAEWLVWLPGLVPGLNVASAAFGSAGDAVMTATPVYPPFLTAPKNQDRELLTNALVWDGERYTFDWSAMESTVTKRTRMFILCNPHNPVGRVYTETELRQLADFCERHDLVLCSDEIHCDLILDTTAKHICTATLGENVAKRTVTLMAPSKTYNIPGLSCSFAVIEDAALRNAFKRAANGFITEVNALGYAGCEAAYQFGEPWRQALVDYLRSNCDYLYTYIREQIPQIKIRPMQATYLAWLDVSGLQLQEPAKFFEEHGVGLSDGAYFGDPRHLRLNFGCPRSMLQTALERMAKAVRGRGGEEVDSRIVDSR